jgi:hypothetical protein
MNSAQDEDAATTRNRVETESHRADPRGRAATSKGIGVYLFKE